MPRTQLGPCLASSLPWGLGSQGLDNGCQFRAASRRFGLATAPAVWERTSTRNKEVFAAWHQLGKSGLKRQSGRFRSGYRRLSSKRAACVLMASREGAAANPMMTEDSSMTYLRSNQNEAHRAVPSENQYISTVALPSIVPRTLRTTQFSLVDQAFLLLGFIACTVRYSDKLHPSVHFARC